MARFIILGDMHLPWINKKTLGQFFDHLASEKFDYCIQIGDIFDYYSQSRFARSHDLMTPKEEVIQAKVMAIDFWARVHKIQKKIKCYQIKGNHDDRPEKRLYEKSPELAPFFDFKSPYEFKNVTTQHSSRDELILGKKEKICFMHGFRTKLGDHAKWNQMPTVCGHTHRGGVVFSTIRGDRGEDRIIYELNAGLCADTSAAPMRYSAQAITHWTQGYGVIDDYGPRFIPAG